MRRCPTCRREVNWDDNEWRPFCSPRCQQLDLGRWASEEYRIPILQPEIEEQFSSELNRDSDDE